MARYNVDLQDNEGNAYQIMANPLIPWRNLVLQPTAKIFVRGETHGLFSVKS